MSQTHNGHHTGLAARVLCASPRLWTHVALTHRRMRTSVGSMPRGVCARTWGRRHFPTLSAALGVLLQQVARARSLRRSTRHDHRACSQGTDHRRSSHRSRRATPALRRVRRLRSCTCQRCCRYRHPRARTRRPCQECTSPDLHDADDCLLELLHSPHEVTCSWSGPGCGSQVMGPPSGMRSSAMKLPSRGNILAFANAASKLVNADSPSHRRRASRVGLRGCLPRAAFDLKSRSLVGLLLTIRKKDLSRGSLESSITRLALAGG